MSKTTKTFTQGSEEWHALRKRAREDLYWFNQKVLGHEPLVPMTYLAHYAMCRFAEHKTGIPEIDNSRVQLILVPRGVGKSTLITKGRTLQRLIQDQDWAAGIMNENSNNARKFLASIKQEFESNEFLQFLFPECIPDFRNTTWKADEIIINRTKPNPVSPSVAAAGADTTVTGIHQNEWIVDDILSEKLVLNAKYGSGKEIEDLEFRVVQIQPLLKNPKQDPLTFIGTTWFPGDTYEFIEDLFGRGEKERKFLWNLRFPDGQNQQMTLIQKGELAIFKRPIYEKGKSWFPERLNEETLEQLQKDDPVFFQGQYMLDPTSGGLAAFKHDYLKEYEWENLFQLKFKDGKGQTKYERLRDLSVVMSVDPAISKKSTAARSAIVITGSNGKALFLLEAWADRVGPSDLAGKIIEFYQRYRPMRIIIEDVAYQTALADVLTLIAKEHDLSALPIFAFRSGSDQAKDQRIMGLEPYFRKGFFYFHNKSHQAFLAEYLSFSPDLKNKTKDILDALSFQKEAWENLGFLGSSEVETEQMKQWKQANQRKIDGIRSRYGKNKTRIREWRRS